MGWDQSTWLTFSCHAPHPGSHGRSHWVQPAVRTKYGEAAFSVYALQLWNKLSEETKNAPTGSTFKSRLKTELFFDAYGWAKLTYFLHLVFSYLSTDLFCYIYYNSLLKSLCFLASFYSSNLTLLVFQFSLTLHPAFSISLSMCWFFVYFVCF